MDDDDLQFGLSGEEESLEEDRSDEIKRALTQLDETFDDESEHSFMIEHRGKNIPALNTAREDMNGNGTNEFRQNSRVFGGRDNNNGVENGVAFSNGNAKKVVRFDTLPEPVVIPGVNRNGRQADRGEEEIEVTNPTLSLLHNKHCPQNGTVGGSASFPGVVNGSATTIEKFEAALSLRDGQIRQLEEEAKNFAKEKRGLNHQIGLMKTEMLQMKKVHEDLQKVIDLREEEIMYQKAKMTEILDEYEAVRQENEKCAEDMNRYVDEAEKLKQQVQLLSSIGSATRGSEMNDVIRQIRDRHAKEIATWQTATAELESQLHIFKRNQQNSHNVSIVPDTEHKYAQTDDPPRKFHKTSEAQTEDPPRKFQKTAEVQTEQPPRATPALAEQSEAISTKRVVQTADFEQNVNLIPIPFSQESIGVEQGGGDNNEKTSLTSESGNKLVEKWMDTIAAVEEEKNRLVDYYEREINEYKTKLAILPSEMYSLWTKQQEELGLLFGNTSGHSKSIPLEPPKINTSTQTEVLQSKEHNGKEDFAAQVRFPGSTLSSSSSTRYSQDPKDTSSVVVQTEETLETFEILGEVIQGWAKEVAVSAKRAEVAEKEAQATAERLELLESSVRKWRKEWMIKEKQLKQRFEDQKSKFLSILSRVSSKLEVVD